MRGERRCTRRISREERGRRKEMRRRRSKGMCPIITIRHAYNKSGKLFFSSRKSVELICEGMLNIIKQEQLTATALWQCYNRRRETGAVVRQYL